MRHTSSLFVVLVLALALIAGLIWFAERYRSLCRVAPSAIGCG